MIRPEARRSRYPSRMATIEGRFRTYHPRSNLQPASSLVTSADLPPTDPYDHSTRCRRESVVCRESSSRMNRGIHYLYLPMVDSASHRDGPNASVRPCGRLRRSIRL